MRMLITFLALFFLSQSAFSAPPIAWSQPYPLILSGGLRIQRSDTSTTCNAGAAGSIRYNAGTFQGCNGSAWASLGGGSSATTALSNLAAVAINTDLIWETAVPAVIQTKAEASSASLTIKSGNTGGPTPSGAVTINSGTVTNSSTGALTVKSGASSNGSGIVSLGSGTAGNGDTSGAVNVTSGNIIDSGSTGNIVHTTGNSIGGGQVSGDIKLTIGTADGTQGAIKFLKSGVASVSGQVWMASSTDGTGYWAASPVFSLGHVIYTNTTPTITANCGTSPSIAGNDVAGRVTVGSGGTANSCTITFANAYATAPACIVGDETTSLLLKGVSTTSTLIISVATAFGAGDKLVYNCVGY